MKTCSKCKIEKDLSEFPKHKGSKDGLYCQCKVCKKEWKLNNKDKVNKDKKIWKLNNKDKVNKQKKQYTEKIKDKPKIIIGDKKTCSKCKIQKPYSDFTKSITRLDGHNPQCRECRDQYRKESQDKIKEYTEKYYQKNKGKRKNNYPFINSLGRKLSKLNKRFKTSFKIIDLLGCSLDDFKTHIESQFQDWINWNTYTFNIKNNYYWYLDFINNNLNSPHELLHYTNIKIIRIIITKKPTPKILPKEGFKICCQCNEEKPLSEFFKNSKNKDGLYCKCKVCRPYSDKPYIKKPKQKLDKKLRSISFNITKSIRRTFKKKGIVKSKTVCEILGCSYQDFKIYIESKFETWMNWDNYGLYNGQLNHGWDLDHIVPKSIAKTEEDILKLNHYTNFRPLCSKTNRDIKKNRLDF